MYAKPIDETTIEVAPYPLILNGKQILGTPTQQQFKQAGYFFVKETVPPEYNANTHNLKHSYPVVDEAINEVWEIVAIDVQVVITEKLIQINAACERAITKGTDVTTTQGTEHFSLTENDQINISSLEKQVDKGTTQVPYHADGAFCRMFSADEIKAVATAAAQHKLYHTTYCNHLRGYVKGLTSVEEIGAVTYGMALPAALQASLTAILTAAGGTTNEKPA